MGRFGSKKQEQVIPKCKECKDEMRPIRLKNKMMWECKVHGIFNKLGKKVLAY